MFLVLLASINTLGDELILFRSLASEDWNWSLMVLNCSFSIKLKRSFSKGLISLIVGGVFLDLSPNALLAFPYEFPDRKKCAFHLMRLITSSVFSKIFFLCAFCDGRAIFSKECWNRNFFILSFSVDYKPECTTGREREGEGEGERERKREREREKEKEREKVLIV